MYDNVVESASKSMLNTHTDNVGLDETEYRTVRSVIGTKQIQSKMIMELLSIDPHCAEVVVDSWKTMIKTTAQLDKDRMFDNLEEYVDYRIIDTGAPFVDTLMRFGMGIILTSEEEESLAPIVKPCYAALGLANDYFSFDVEWEELQADDSGKKTMTNLVWLFMQWYKIDIAEAKERVREVTNQYEREYQQQVKVFMATEGKGNAKIGTYLKALGHQIPGNVVWSLRCARYHPELCEDASKLLSGDHGISRGKHFPYKEKEASKSTDLSRSPRKSPSDSEASDDSRSLIWSASHKSSVSSASSVEENNWSPKRESLHDAHMLGPAEYISALPSKGIRESFIHALNVWLMLPDYLVNQINQIAHTLHNASLMLDDIEDSSLLRRGRPATHTVFGVGQTINSANFLLLQAADQVRQLDDSQCLDTFFEEIRHLFIGQSFDLYWTQEGECPSEEQYLAMVGHKTGGLFRLIVRLMIQKGQSQDMSVQPSLETLSDLFGEYFQIRDDYKNLTEEYTGQKGFCEDLDEGKFSFPLIHALTSKPNNFELLGILRQARLTNSLDVSLKQCILDHLQQAGSMEYTKKTLSILMGRIDDLINALEKHTGCPNWIMRLLVSRLEVR
ncbi:hypothetical protein ZTR_03640 [Talaromyces verruculosus]|nr:hypothetical protein ZTR_03640 [Talaromyces verruculosus]